MKILSSDEHLLFREKVRNKQISGMVHLTGHVTGQMTLIGAFHG